MANILLTKFCNRNCSYCFAQAKLTEDSPDSNITFENFDRYLTMLKDSKLRVVSLLGGEPTLHPKFSVIMDRCLNDDYFKLIKLFSNGLMPDNVIDYLEACSDNRVQIALNIHPADKYSPEQWRTIQKVLSKLNDKTALGYNIHKTGNRFDFLLQLYLDYGLQPHIRLGLTQPILGVNNAHLNIADFQNVGSEIMAVAHKFTNSNLFFSFDCGFPFCMFTTEQHKILLDHAINFRSLCDPIIDVSTQLNIWRCFPLSQVHNIHINDYETRMDMVHYYKELLNPYRQFGIHEKCIDCNYKIQNICCGGCLARVMKSFNIKNYGIKHEQ